MRVARGGAKRNPWLKEAIIFLPRKGQTNHIAMCAKHSSAPSGAIVKRALDDQGLRFAPPLAKFNCPFGA
jgi:hypothetical protein